VTKYSISRIEGEGRVELIVEDNRVVDVWINIVEAPRFFESIVLGKPYTIIPDIVSRICGLCGVSYQYVSIYAFEKCLGYNIPREVEEFRKTIHLLEWIKSHVVNVFLQLTPDIAHASLLDNTQAMDNLAKNIVKFMEWNRRSMITLAGRFHNVVNLKIGGVYKLPELYAIQNVYSSLNDVVKTFEDVIDIILTREIPEYGLLKVREVALHNPGEYPHLSNTLYVRGSNSYINIDRFEELVEVVQKPWSNSLLYTLRNGGEYVVGPVARFNNYAFHLHGETKDLLKRYGWFRELKYISQSIVARIAEIHDALMRIRDYLSNYRVLNTSNNINRGFEKIERCIACIEAPRGILYHRYDVDVKGFIKKSKIITPTSQNLASMHRIVYDEVSGERVSEDVLRKVLLIIRSFDPCLSCSVHFTRVD